MQVAQPESEGRSRTVGEVRHGSGQSKSASRRGQERIRWWRTIAVNTAKACDAAMTISGALMQWF